MVTKREYLVQKGLAKDGRGRFSLAAKQAITDAINTGVKFSEAETKSSSSEVPTTAAARTDRPDGLYTFQNEDGTTFTRSHTLACLDCHMSLPWCGCAMPQVAEYHKGYIDTVKRATLISSPSRVEQTEQEAAPRRGRGRPRKTA